jgi:hypothetical protein
MPGNPDFSVLLDDFNRANEGPPPSASWTTGTVAGLIVLANECTRQAAGGFRQDAYWNASQFGPNCEVGCRIAAWTDLTNNEIWWFTRTTPTATRGYAFRLEGSTGSPPEWLGARVGLGVVQASVSNLAVTAGDYIACQSIQSRHRMWHRPISLGLWSVILNWEDAAFPSPGFVRIEITNNQNTRFDDFWARTLPDDVDLAPRVYGRGAA